MSIFKKSNCRIAALAVAVFALDQFTKWLVLHLLPEGDEKIVIRGFFRFVHWDNTGAAWSLFRNNNGALALVALVALFALIYMRDHFNAHRFSGQIALGLIFGGIAGNLMDRLRIGHVTDFIYFYLQKRGGGQIGFPAFNIADSAICTGVALVFLITWKNENQPKPMANGK
ncbi:MAG TPA: signal peptidase II [Verrucomicrobiae bacterium]|nr:signal peptidase II [Verrucomicrobiae bacterium]